VEAAETGYSGTSGAETRQWKEDSIAALRELRHPKAQRHMATLWGVELTKVRRVRVSII